MPLEVDPNDFEIVDAKPMPIMDSVEAGFAQHEEAPTTTSHALHWLVRTRSLLSDNYLRAVAVLILCDPGLRPVNESSRHESWIGAGERCDRYSTLLSNN